MEQAKTFMLSIILTDKLDGGYDKINECISAVKALATINGKYALGSLSAPDRERLVETILVNAKNLADLSDEEVKRKIRTALVGYMYNRSFIKETKDVIYNEFLQAGLQNKLIPQLPKSLNSHIQISEADLKHVILEDFAAELANKLDEYRHSNTSAEITSNIYSVSNGLNQNAMKYIIESAQEILGEGREFSILDIARQVETFTKSVFDKFLLQIRHLAELLAKNTIEMIRKREELLNLREIKCEEESKKNTEISQQNVAFSADLKKKANEVESMMDQLAIRRSELDDMLQKMLKMANRIIKICEEAKS